VAGASRTIPRGAEVEIPEGRTLRLFLHWTEPEGLRVDLDLSVGLFDRAWGYLGRCDYTRLRDDRGAVHSGDLTSAPAPLGATECIDLDLAALDLAGVAYVVPAVFSYNDVPFERMDDAFAGFSLPVEGGALLDPARVALRFDLTGASRIVVPMTVNLADRTLRWADLHLTSIGYGHAVGGYDSAMARAGEDLELAYGGGRRPTMLDLAAIHATARAGDVWVRHRDGGATRIDPGRPDAFEAIRACTDRRGESELPALDGRPVLFFAADRLPEAAGGAGPGSVLVAATTGDPRATHDPMDLVTDL
jgi:hypothetical protein